MTAGETVPPATLGPFQEAVENTGHSIYWTDTSGRIEYVNPAFEEQTGYSAEEAVGSNANILQSGVHDDRFYEELWETILNGSVWKGEIVNERKSGERYVVKQTISPVTGESGTVTRFVAVNEDITEQRASQNQLERERDRFAALLDAVPVPLVLLDIDDEPVVKRTNESFQERFGFTGRELGELSLDDVIVAESESAEARELNTRVLRGERVNREVTRQTADGESGTFILNAVPFSRDDRSEALAAYIDITDQKETRRKLQRRTEELENFANVVSHDLRNPLNVASGNLELLRAECESSHIDTIQHAHTRMQELIENILMLAKQGKSIDKTEPVPLAACVPQSWETIDTGSATLEVETQQTIRADDNRLRQLFGNLIRNSVEHGSDDVTVTVGDLEDGFYVADDGPGIPAAERSKVFEAGHTNTESGTGFGLSIVREIVDAHGWTIRITEGPDGGARFEITGVSSVS